MIDDLNLEKVFNSNKELKPFKKHFAQVVEILNKEEEENVLHNIFPNRFKFLNINDKDEASKVGLKNEESFYKSIKNILKNNKEWTCICDLKISTLKRKKKVDFILVNENYGIFLIDSKSAINENILDHLKEQCKATEEFLNELIGVNYIPYYYVHYTHSTPLNQDSSYQSNNVFFLQQKDLSDSVTFTSWKNKFKEIIDNSIKEKIKLLKYFLVSIRYFRYNFDQEFDKFFNDLVSNSIKIENADLFKENKLILKGIAGSGKSLFLLNKIEKTLTSHVQSSSTESNVTLIISSKTDFLYAKLWSYLKKKKKNANKYELYFYREAQKFKEIENVSLESVSSISVYWYYKNNILQKAFCLIKGKKNNYFLNLFKSFTDSTKAIEILECLNNNPNCKLYLNVINSNDVIERMKNIFSKLTIEEINDKIERNLKNIVLIIDFRFIIDVLFKIYNNTSIFELNAKINIFVDDAMATINQKNRFIQSKMPGIANKINVFWLTFDIYQHYVYNDDNTILYPGLDLEFKVSVLDKSFRFSAGIFDTYVKPFYDFVRNLDENELFEGFSSFDKLFDFVKNKNKNLQTNKSSNLSNEKIKLNDTVINVFKKLVSHEVQLNEYFVDGSSEYIPVSKDVLIEMLKTKIESKINTYNENTFELTHKSRFGIFIDGNEYTYKHLKSIDQSFKNMTESTEKLKKKLIDELKIYLNNNKLGERCELCDMNDSRSYFSVEYAMLIYVVPGVTGIIQNKGSEKKKETFRIDAYFALTRSTHDLTIIYVDDLDINNSNIEESQSIETQVNNNLKNSSLGNIDYTLNDSVINKNSDINQWKLNDLMETEEEQKNEQFENQSSGPNIKTNENNEIENIRTEKNNEESDSIIETQPSLTTLTTNPIGGMPDLYI